MNGVAVPRAIPWAINVIAFQANSVALLKVECDVFAFQASGIALLKVDGWAARPDKVYSPKRASYVSAAA